MSDPSPIITLTTDFGVGSPYVAQMKGVILSLNRQAQVIDITHGISPQDIREGALVLADVCHHFPTHTIHVVVVDPGVGTDRKVLFAQVGNQRFIAPDNGVLTLVARRTAPSQVLSISQQRIGTKVSNTFHGRDVLAVVAARLSLGEDPQQFGEPLSTLVTLPIPSPRMEPGRMTGQVIQVDSFGNLITNIALEDLQCVPNLDVVSIRCGSAATTGVVRTYGSRSPGTLVALIGSSDRLELAIVHGSAAASFSAKRDDFVEVSW